MASKRVNLELPLAYSDADFDRLMNERLRRIAELLGGGTGSTPAQLVGASGATTLILAVAGTLSIRSNAALLVAFPSQRTFTSITGLLKRAAAGGDVVARLLIAGAEKAALNVPAGATAATLNMGNVTVAAGALVTVDITSVGSSFPGADLTLMIS